MQDLVFAAVAMTALSAGTAFAGEGGGDGGNRFFDPNTAPPGFYDMNPAYQAQQAREAYVVNQERAWQVAHAASGKSVAQSATRPNA